jgi:hypothetical protein
MLGIAGTRLDVSNEAVSGRIVSPRSRCTMSRKSIEGIAMTCKGVRSTNRTGYKSREEGMYLEFDLEAVLVRLPS